jgi:chemotaxis protein CheD
MHTIPSHLSRVEVQPGQRYVTRGAYDVKTLLGSCVAACLYDPQARVGGLNHFLLAAPRYAKSMPLTVTEAGRYGIHAMELLINDMMKLGAARKRLEAKVFGGASVLGFSGNDRFACVSEVNQRFILEFLETEGIKLVSHDLGGGLGRVIHFHTDTYKVYRRFIQKRAMASLLEAEHRYWQENVEKPEKREGEIVLF